MKKFDEKKNAAENLKNEINDVENVHVKIGIWNVIEDLIF